MKLTPLNNHVFVSFALEDLRSNEKTITELAHQCAEKLTQLQTKGKVTAFLGPVGYHYTCALLDEKNDDTTKDEGSTVFRAKFAFEPLHLEKKLIRIGQEKQLAEELFALHPAVYRIFQDTYSVSDGKIEITVAPLAIYLAKQLIVEKSGLHALVAHTLDDYWLILCNQGMLECLVSADSTDTLLSKLNEILVAKEWTADSVSITTLGFPEGKLPKLPETMSANNDLRTLDEILGVKIKNSCLSQTFSEKTLVNEDDADTLSDEPKTTSPLKQLLPMIILAVFAGLLAVGLLAMFFMR